MNFSFSWRRRLYQTGSKWQKGKFWKSGVHAISVLNHHVCEMHDMKESLLFPFAFPGGYLIFWSSQGLDSEDYSQVGSLLETYAFFWCILERGDHTQLWEDLHEQSFLYKLFQVQQDKQFINLRWIHGQGLQQLQQDYNETRVIWIHLSEQEGGPRSCC